MKGTQFLHVLARPAGGSTTPGGIASLNFHAVVGPIDVRNAGVQRRGAAIGADVVVFEIADVAVAKSQVATAAVAGGKLFHPAMLHADFLGRNPKIRKVRGARAAVAHENIRGRILDHR